MIRANLASAAITSATFISAHTADATINVTAGKRYAVVGNYGGLQPAMTVSGLTENFNMYSKDPSTLPIAGYVSAVITGKATGSSISVANGGEYAVYELA